jgi:uncharacterized coiled-coil protein SlyX
MSMSTLIGRTAKILELSDIIARQRRLIAAQRAYINLLREQLDERKAWRESLPPLLRRQAE